MTPSLETSYHQSEQLFVLRNFISSVRTVICSCKFFTRFLKISMLLRSLILLCWKLLIILYDFPSSILSKVSLTSIDFIIILFDDHVIKHFLTFHTYLNRLIYVTNLPSSCDVKRGKTTLRIIYLKSW